MKPSPKLDAGLGALLTGPKQLLQFMALTSAMATATLAPIPVGAQEAEAGEFAEDSTETERLILSRLATDKKFLDLLDIFEREMVELDSLGKISLLDVPSVTKYLGVLDQMMSRMLKLGSDDHTAWSLLRTYSEPISQKLVEKMKPDVLQAFINLTVIDGHKVLSDIGTNPETQVVFYAYYRSAHPLHTK